VDIKALWKNRVLRRFVLWPAVVVAVYAIAGFFILPPVARSVLVRQLTEKLHRPVAYGRSDSTRSIFRPAWRDFP